MLPERRTQRVHLAAWRKAPSLVHIALASRKLLDCAGPPLRGSNITTHPVGPAFHPQGCFGVFGAHRVPRQTWLQAARYDFAYTLGFSIGKASPVLFCHQQRSLKCLVHGDDFVVSGEPTDLVWMRNELESKLEIDTAILGHWPRMSKEVKILNRKLRWHDGVGISWEADQKHAEAIMRKTGASFDTFESLHVQVKHMNGVVLGDASATLAIVARRRVGQIVASGHQQLVDPRESSRR